jgi:hypothetical protein
MSASDAAPLPRLGEVFFDVRGSSRSMRLSWYADTGVAVFSIWQGGMCTGTFRLPIGDLPRMIEILQRGPQDEAHSMHEADDADWGVGYTGQRDYPAGGSRRPERDPRLVSSDRPSYRDDQAETAAAGFGHEDLGDRYGRDVEPEDPRGREYGSGRRRSGYDQDDRRVEPRRPGYDYAEPLGEPRRPGYEPPAPRDTAFLAGQAPDPGGQSTGWDAFSDGPYPGYEPQPPSGDAQLGWGDSADPSAGYGQERFVPPYVRSAGGEYPHDIPGRGPDLPGGEGRAAYRSGPPSGRSAADDYPEPSWAPGGYSDSGQYRLPGAPLELPDRWTQHQYDVPYGDASQPEPEPGGHLARPFPADDIDGEAPDFRSRRPR